MDSFKSKGDLSGPLYDEMFSMIEIRKKSLHTAVNSELVSLYWNIGRALRTEMSKNSKNGKSRSLVEDLSKELSIKYGRGYGTGNLLEMVKFNELYPDYDVVAALATQLTWSHFLELIKIEDNLKRNFYVNHTNNERWSVKTLRDKINSKLYETVEISRKPFEALTAGVNSFDEVEKTPADQFFRDQHILDFLGMEDSKADYGSGAQAGLINSVDNSQHEVLDYLMGIDSEG